MHQTKRYTCFVSENQVPVVVLPCESGCQSSVGRILYDGGAHALLHREGREVTLLDYLDEDFRPFLMSASKALIFEVDLETQEIMQDYDVPIMHLQQLPAFEMETVEKYLAQKG